MRSNFMRPVAYLANSFPEPVEAYVGEEILELRRRGCEVVPCSFRRPRSMPPLRAGVADETIYIFPVRVRTIFSACWLLVRRVGRIADLIGRALRGRESTSRRVRTLIHTWLGAYLAAVLGEKQIRHIHIHHGYFASWAGMVAARLLDSSFSLTLHGSDLLIRGDYLDCKLANCKFCVTVSDFNRNYILEHYPEVDSRKILVHRLGVNPNFWRPIVLSSERSPFSILSVGRLHRVKNYGFLVLACRALKTEGVNFRCVIAGGGDQREGLQQLINEEGLERDVVLLGHVRREQLRGLYAGADVVVLTSRSEGIPVALMEAMAMQRVVLAPEITGIPELVRDGQTGFLYEPNVLDDFLARVRLIQTSGSRLDSVRQSARHHVEMRFDRRINLEAFAADFMRRASVTELSASGQKVYEDPVLQQVQLRVQRDRSLPV